MTRRPRPGGLVRSPPFASRNRQKTSGAAATTVPGERVPASGLGPEAGQVARRVPLTKNGPPSYLGGDKPPCPQPHAAATADAFDATHEYCTPAAVFFWLRPSCISQWTPSRFTIDRTSPLCAEQHFAAETSRLFGVYDALHNIMRVFDPRLHKQYGREVRNFDAVVGEHERENIVLVGSYAKFTQNPVM